MLMMNHFYAGPLMVNCYLVYDEESKEAFIVDPGGKNPELERFIDVEWEDDAMDGNAYEAEIYILADDRRKLLMDVSIALQECDVDVKNLNIKTTKDNKAVFNTTVAITEKGQMSKILTKLKSVPGVIEAYRATV